MLGLRYYHAWLLKKFTYLFICLFMSMGGLPASMSVHHVHTVPTQARRGHRIIRDRRCELPCECGEQNPGLVEGEPMLITTDLSSPILLCFKNLVGGSVK